MGKILLKRAAWISFCGVLVWSGVATAEDRPVSTILAEIKAVELPAKLTDDSPTPAARTAYASAYSAAMEKKSKLIGELAKADPTNADLPELLPIRFQTLMMKPATRSTLKSEVEAILATSHNDKLLAEAHYYKVQTTMIAAGPDTKPEALLEVFNTFATRFPKDPRVPTLLMGIAGRTKDLDAKIALYHRVEQDYPDSPMAKKAAGSIKRAEGAATQSDRVGKPFVLEFSEATKGSQISIASLKGKVVVIDFWATWCGPCIKEMPNMKKLYAEYKDQGVEFIGVSLDVAKEEGGLDKLKQYVAKNGIEWPQYYQGNYWDSDFSSSWGINAIPAVFLIDADGNLATVDARGKLEELIPEYLEKAKDKAKKTASNP